MECLDREEAEARVVSAPMVTAQEVAGALADQQALFLGAKPVTQHRIAQALCLQPRGQYRFRHPM